MRYFKNLMCEKKCAYRGTTEERSSFGYLMEFEIKRNIDDDLPSMHRHLAEESTTSKGNYIKQQSFTTHNLSFAPQHVLR